MSKTALIRFFKIWILNFGFVSALRISCFIRRSSLLLLPLLIGSTLGAQDNIGILGSKPKWDVLEHYQRTITHDEFAHLINDVYCTHGIPSDLITADNDAARIVTEHVSSPGVKARDNDAKEIVSDRQSQKVFTLHFAPDLKSEAKVPRLWRPAKSMSPAKPNKPLAGVRIALDPGHLGGRWAKMEERWFQVGESKPVTEGDLTLRVSRLLATRLKKLGATVLFVRNSTQPTTSKRPADFRELAKNILIKNGVPRPRDEVLNPKDPEKEGTVRWQSEMLFYRYSEIRRRAVLVNNKLHPDLVVCLHFNAEGWGDPANPTLIDTNHLHLLVNGSYLQDEIGLDDERFEMIRRLLSRVYDEELPIADAVASSMAKATGLPPYQYPTTQTTTKVGTTGYVYARNLLATRLYRCPVVYCEPYVMNSNEAFARIEAGDYDGTKEINGVQRKSIFREYADGVAEGLADYYRNARK